MSVNGHLLRSWGLPSGKYFKDALAEAKRLDQIGLSAEEVRSEIVNRFMPVVGPKIELQDPTQVPIFYNIETETDYEKENLEKVKAHMDELAKVPTIKAMAVMPDACPVGYQPGTIPVGGVAAAYKAIHPGMHSSDICCSMAMSILDTDANPTAILDAGMKLSHFGPGGRAYSHDMRPSQDLLDAFEANKFLACTSAMATKFYGTQGDGNHFFYVGRLRSSGQIVLVTHHGSRKPGAELYKKGMKVAEKHTKELAEGVPSWNAWIPSDTEDGEEYWEALQLIRTWTKNNHYTIHDAVAKNLGLKVRGRMFNEHNFVFKRGDMFFHAKGATPNYAGFAADAIGMTLIPLNMAQPILVTETNADYDHGVDLQHNSLGFSPHGAGRNFSRSHFINFLSEQGLTPKQLIAEVSEKYDVRAFHGKHDISEFPLAYKNANQIVEAIKKYNLAKVVDFIDPLGTIMAGHTGYSWREKKERKKGLI